MSVRTLERRLAHLQAKQRSFDHWSDEELDHAIKLYSRSPDQLTPEEKKELQRYSVKTLVPGEIAAIPEELLDRQIQGLKESLGYQCRERTFRSTLATAATGREWSFIITES